MLMLAFNDFFYPLKDAWDGLQQMSNESNFFSEEIVIGDFRSGGLF